MMISFFEIHFAALLLSYITRNILKKINEIRLLKILDHFFTLYLEVTLLI